MPVVQVYFDRLTSMLRGKASKKHLEQTIPYLGLDLEEVTDEYLRIEYNPNRPDFATDYGLAKALNSFLGFESKWDDYKVAQGRIIVKVDQSIQRIRPYLVGAVAKNIRLDDESIRQLIALQEDLHNGIGRMRRKVSIGVHNLDALKPPLEYLAIESSFQFVPLNETRSMKMSEILTETETGREYAHLVNRFPKYPLLRDSAGGVLSFPPVINGNLTKLDNNTKNLFVDITATDLKTAEDALAVLATTLSDAGANIESVNVQYPDNVIVTPDLTPHKSILEPEYANKLLGLRLTKEEVLESLRRSRITAKIVDGKIEAIVPRYRIDIMHPVDLVEEVALGFGVFRIEPSFPTSTTAGKYNQTQVTLSRIREVFVGLGMMEVVNFSLVGEELLRNTGINSPMIKVDKSKSAEHEVLRPSLMPSLLLTFSRNIHEEYPQRIFEIGKVFSKEMDEIDEEYRVAGAIAHSTANFTEIHSYLSSLLKQTFGAKFATKATSNAPFIDGRTAAILYEGENCGVLGEVHPKVLQSFGMRNPVAAFEVRLFPFLRDFSPS